MNKKYSFVKLLLLLVFIPACAFCGYQQSPYVDDEAWKEVQPYLLPYNHPIRKNLDRIFSKSRATETKESLQKAGFKILSSRGNHVLPVKHKAIKGYLLKVYTDKAKPGYHANAIDWKKFLKRIHGAQMIRQAIAKNAAYSKHFVVAKKWLYPLPKSPEAQIRSGYKRRNFVLVVEDLKLVSSEENLSFWKSILSKNRLQKLFFLCRDLGLQDSIRPANTWWTQKRKLAFVDTEQFEHWPICLNALYKHMPPRLKKSLDVLIKTEGKGLMY